jgi:lysophospholipase L1-like esterase
MSNSLRYDKFLIFGDSITEFSYDPLPQGSALTQFGFGGALQNTYTRRLDVIQRGLSGYNTDWALAILPKILEYEHTEQSQIKIATIFFGTNDAVFQGMQKVEIPQYVDNMRKMIQLLQDRGIKVIVIGQGKHDKDNWNQRKPQDIEKGILRSNEHAMEYNRALDSLAQELKVAYVDLYAGFEQYEGNWRDLLIDGVHFTGEGYKVMFQLVLDQIKKHYPEFLPENLTYKLPYWRNFDSVEGLQYALGDWLQ